MVFLKEKESHLFIHAAVGQRMFAWFEFGESAKPLGILTYFLRAIDSIPLQQSVTNSFLSALKLSLCKL